MMLPGCNDGRAIGRGKRRMSIEMVGLADIVREIRSFAPPGANGETTVMPFAGQD